MPELVLLSFSRAEIGLTVRSARAGDEQSMQALEHIWENYQDRELECFICGNLAAHPPFTQFLPERTDFAKVIAAPLCTTCRDLPKMVQLNRALKLLKKMYSAQSGKNITFSFRQRHRR